MGDYRSLDGQLPNHRPAPEKESPSCGFFPLAQSLPWTQPGQALGRVVHSGEHVWYILAEHRWCIFGEHHWYICVRLLTNPPSLCLAVRIC
jgi:hypothetical protein